MWLWTEEPFSLFAQLFRTFSLLLVSERKYTLSGAGISKEAEISVVHTVFLKANLSGHYPPIYLQLTSAARAEETNQIGRTLSQCWS